MLTIRRETFQGNLSFQQRRIFVVGRVVLEVNRKNHGECALKDIHRTIYHPQSIKNLPKRNQSWLTGSSSPLTACKVIEFYQSAVLNRGPDVVRSRVDKKLSRQGQVIYVFTAEYTDHRGGQFQ